MKSRKQKQIEYNEKYNNIPKNFKERLLYMCDKYNITEKKAEEIINSRNKKLNSLIFKEIKLVLYQLPEGAKRPRGRVCRTNYVKMAEKHPNLVHVYSPGAKEDNLEMRRIVGSELHDLSKLICTPIILTYNSYIQTPKSWNVNCKFTSEIGLDRPIFKPDWDNIGKKYSDMSNLTIWLDDALVISGKVNKYYSELPKIEIDIKYLNMVYNKYQYNSLIKRKDFKENKCILKYIE